MNKIKGLLLAIFMLLLSISLHTAHIGREMSNFLYIIAYSILPIAAIITVIISFLFIED